MALVEDELGEGQVGQLGLGVLFDDHVSAFLARRRSVLASKADLRPAEKPRASKKPYWQRAQQYELPTHLFLPLRNIEMSRLRGQWAKESRLHMN